MENKLYTVTVTYEANGGSDCIRLRHVKRIDIGTQFITFVNDEGTFTQRLDKLINYTMIKE